MSRIGRLPITVPAGVTVTVDADNLVTVKGPKGTLSQQVNSAITVKQEGNVLTLERPTDSKPHKAMHGLYRALVHNMVVGVTDGFTKTLELDGTGYRAQADGGKKLTINIGFSHPVILDSGLRMARISAPSVSLNPTWARASSTRMSTSAARKARPVRSKRGSDCKCSKSVTGMRCA